MVCTCAREARVRLFDGDGGTLPRCDVFAESHIESSKLSRRCDCIEAVAASTADERDGSMLSNKLRSRGEYGAGLDIGSPLTGVLAPVDAMLGYDESRGPPVRDAKSRAESANKSSEDELLASLRVNDAASIPT
jgi:hypothetical protein